jgi:hypothetical protein
MDRARKRGIRRRFALPGEDSERALGKTSGVSPLVRQTRQEPGWDRAPGTSWEMGWR